MTPIGNHIAISSPERITESELLLEPENCSKAFVEQLTPDVKLPFKKNDIVYFYTGKHIVHTKGDFLNVDMIVGWELT